MNRAILLGASNLTLSLRLIIHLMRQYCAEPCEVLAAAGHGRSYGRNSRVLVRDLPGIVQSGLWRQLHSIKAEEVHQTYAFLTDVGNDIPYEADPDKILGWVTWCVDQLAMHDARIVMTNLPMASIETMSEMKFNMLRRVMFPSCSLTRNEVVARARQVHQGLIDLAKHRRLMINELDVDSMSFDGIHIAYRKRQVFYQHVLKSFDLGDPNNVPVRREDALLSWQRRPRFAVRRIFGKIEQHQQPSGLLEDQTAVSLY